MDGLCYFAQLTDMIDQAILFKTIATFLSQAAIAIILFAMFLHFSKLYQRKALSIWAFSWLALALFMITSAWLQGNLKGNSGYFRIFISSLSIASCFGQMVFIFLGIYIQNHNLKLTTKNLLLLVLIIFGLSLVLVLIKNGAPDEALVRYTLRIGVKYLIAGVGFLWAGWMILVSRSFGKGLGQRIFSLSLIGIGLTDLGYSLISISSNFHISVEIPAIFGLMELFFNSLVGIGMITWLLEDEGLKLAKINKEMDSFFYSTSHDLRAPIASILGLVNLANLELKDPTALLYFEMVENRVKKMDSVISDILQLAKSAKSDLSFEVIDFNKLLYEVIADVKFNKGAKEINLRYAPGNYLLSSDYNQLKIILGNLIGNAVKYHFIDQQDPYIAVRFVQSEVATLIEVEDNGTGILKEHQVKIFEMFYRASTQSEGTGLGLYIAMESVHKLNGQISVKSEVGKGSIFTVNLPIMSS